MYVFKCETVVVSNKVIEARRSQVMLVQDGHVIAKPFDQALSAQTQHNWLGTHKHPH